MKTRAIPGGWQAAGLLLAAVLVYLPALRAGFVWDDGGMLVRNPVIPAPDGLSAIWLGREGHDYLPLTMTSFWIEWRLWGLNPAGYHAVNILLHAAASVLLWRVLLRLDIPGAWLAALLFAVHPVNAASVAWVAERKNTLSQVFYLAAALFYVRSEREGKRREYWLSLAFFLCALLAKASVVMFPVVLWLLAWWRRGTISRQDVRKTAPFFLLSLLAGLAAIWFQNHRAIEDAVVPMGDFGTRLATAAWAPGFYLLKLLFPVSLSMLYPHWRIAPLQPGWLVPVAATAGIFAAAFVFRRSWGRPVLFALGYFVITLFPVLGFFRMYYFRLSPVADHWQYAAGAGILALVAAAWVTHFPRLSARPAGYVLAGFVVAVLGVLTWQRAGLFQDEHTFWTDVLKKDPRSWTAHTNLAIDLLGKKKIGEALVFARRPVEIEPRYVEGHLNLAFILAQAGRFDEAARNYQEALAVDPDHFEARRELAGAWERAGNISLALAAYRDAIRLRPDDFPTRQNLGALLYRQGLVNAALAEFREGVRLRPDSAPARNNLAGALYVAGDVDGAIREYREALRLEPAHEGARRNLDILLRIRGRQ